MTRSAISSYGVLERHTYKCVGLQASKLDDTLQSLFDSNTWTCFGEARPGLVVSQQMKCTAVRGEARSSPASQNIIDKLLGSCKPSRQRSAEQRCCVAGGFSGPTQGIGRRAARVAAVKASSAVCRSHWHSKSNSSILVTSWQTVG